MDLRPNLKSSLLVLVKLVRCGTSIGVSDVEGLDAATSPGIKDDAKRFYRGESTFPPATLTGPRRG